MKQLLNMLFLSILLFSCTKQEDNQWNLYSNGQDPSETKEIKLMLSKSSLSVFEEKQITELAVFVYLGDSLVYGKNLPLNDGKLQIEVPLGEELKTFVVANADHMADTDSLSTVTIYQDASSQKEIFVSEIVSFMSDKTIDIVTLELKRMVGQAVFQPIESSSELAAVSDFDALEIKFNNVVIGFMPGVKRYVLQDVTIPTTADEGYIASVFSFPSSDESAGSIEVRYLKNNTEVNKTLRPLDAAIIYEASKRTLINMPILNGNYLEKSFSTNTLKVQRNDAKIVLYKSQF